MGIIKYIDNIPLFSTSKEAFQYGIEINFLKPNKGDSEVDTHIHKCSVGPNAYRSGYMPGRSHTVLMHFLTSGGKYDDNNEIDTSCAGGYMMCECGVTYFKSDFKENPCKKLCFEDDDGYDDDGYDDDKCKGYGWKKCQCPNGKKFEICDSPGNDCAKYYDMLGCNQVDPPIGDDGFDEYKGQGDDREISQSDSSEGLTNYPIR